jgi:hypothetical protein
MITDDKQKLVFNVLSKRLYQPMDFYSPVAVSEREHKRGQWWTPFITHDKFILIAVRMDRHSSNLLLVWADTNEDTHHFAGVDLTYPITWFERFLQSSKLEMDI